MIELSIIIPIFNRESTLELCLNSLLKTNIENKEILLIDDGSTDSSSIICKKYSERFHNFKYIYKQNGGVSSARNVGLSKAQGTWITFIDSDDAVRKEHFDILKDNNIKNVDFLIESFISIGLDSFHDENYELPALDLTNNISDTPSIYYFKEVPKTNTPMFSVCGKFYKRDICFNYNIKFREDIHLGEDQIFNLDYLLHTNVLCHYPNMRTYIQIEREIKDNGKRLSSIVYPLNEYFNFIETSYNKFRLFDSLSNNYNIKYSINNMVSGIVNLTLINYQRKKYAQLIEKDELYLFTIKKIYPLFSSAFPYFHFIDDYNIRFIFLLIVKKHVRIALLYTKLISLNRSVKFHLKKYIR